MVVVNGCVERGDRTHRFGEVKGRTELRRERKRSSGNLKMELEIWMSLEHSGKCSVSGRIVGPGHCTLGHRHPPHALKTFSLTPVNAGAQPDGRFEAGN